MESHIVVEWVIFDCCQSHVSHSAPFTTQNCQVLKLYVEWDGGLLVLAGVIGPRTMHLGGQLVLGPRVHRGQLVLSPPPVPPFVFVFTTV